MPTHEIILLISAACGFVIVIGSLVLLFKGAITLHSASESGTLSVEIVDKVKISTSYPALGLFVIGLAFIAVSFLFSEPVTTYRFDGALTANVEEGEPRFNNVVVSLSGGPWSLRPTTEGRINEDVTPTLSNLRLEVIAPGFSRARFEDVFSLAGRRVALGEINLGSQIQSEIREGVREGWHPEDADLDWDNVPTNAF